VTRAAADVGGVGGPVPGGNLLPLGRDLDVDAEGLGQDCGGDFGGQGEQGGAAALPRADPEGVEPLGEASSVSALPGRCPGNSQGEGMASRQRPRVSRPAASLVTRSSSGAGSTIGRLPRRSRVRSS
jgi:hypothetical protein